LLILQGMFCRAAHRPRLSMAEKRPV
jgi:hypothetical protein